MIPKIIHYVWVGTNNIPPQYLDYMKKWESLMPDWNFKLWSENNFDVKKSQFCYDAYKEKKWAFVSDYIRVSVMYEYGGIYLDIDEEMIQSLDEFCNHKAFFGLEPRLRLQCGVFGCEARSHIMKTILDHYNQLLFINDAVLNETVIGEHFEYVIKGLYPSLRLKEEITTLDDGVVIYPSTYFCPDLATLCIDENTYTVHRPMGSWLSPYAKFKKTLYVTVVENSFLRFIYRILKR